MVTDIAAVVTAFLDGMYYAGKLPARRESYDIAKWLVKHRLSGLHVLDVERVVSAQMTALHARVMSEETGEEQK